MKKTFIAIALLLASVSSAIAADDYLLSTISLTYKSIHVGTGLSHYHPRIPANPPVVYIDGHTILFESKGFCDYIQIFDPESKECVYDTVVLEDTNHVILPMDLQGEFEIRFCRETYYYYSEIEL